MRFGFGWRRLHIYPSLAPSLCCIAPVLGDSLATSRTGPVVGDTAAFEAEQTSSTAEGEQLNKELEQFNDGTEGQAD